MANDYRQIVSGKEKGSWRNIKIDRSYARTGESFNPVNCKGFIVYYTDTKTTDQSVTVSIAYVFFLGVSSPFCASGPLLIISNRSTMRLSTTKHSFVMISSRPCARTW